MTELKKFLIVDAMYGHSGRSFAYIRRAAATLPQGPAEPPAHLATKVLSDTLLSLSLYYVIKKGRKFTFIVKLTSYTLHLTSRFHSIGNSRKSVTDVD